MSGTRATLTGARQRHWCAALAAASLAGCQLVSGLDTVEVVHHGSGGLGGGTATSAASGLVCDSAYTNVKQGECDLLSQDCGASDTCYVAADPGGGAVPACIEAKGTKGEAFPCASDDECAVGLVCVWTCTRVCCPGPGVGANQPCGMGSCNVRVALMGSDEFFFVCAYGAACVLFTPGTCASGLACHPTGNGSATCSPPSGVDAPEGGSCEFVNDCDDMQVCVGSPGASLCRYACEMGSAAAPGFGGCPQSQTCKPLSGFDDVGVCIPA